MGAFETRPCEWCNRGITRYRSQFQGERTFCSNACAGAYRSAYRVGNRAANWKGGEKINGGRTYWFMPWHHGADAKGYVARSRIVMELKLGRSLLSGEVVHHRDEDPANDHPDNLNLYPSQAEHARSHGYQRSPELMARMRAARGKAA